MAWKKQALALLPDVFSDKGKQEAVNHDMQLAELYEQIGRLKPARGFPKYSRHIPSKSAWMVRGAGRIMCFLSGSGVLSNTNVRMYRNGKVSVYFGRLSGAIFNFTIMRGRIRNIAIGFLPQ